MKCLRHLILLIVPLNAFCQEIELVAPRYHYGDINSMDLSVDGKFIVSAGSYDNTIFLREASTGNYLREFVEKDKANTLKFLADSKHFIIQNSTGIVIRDISNSEAKQRIDGKFLRVAARLDRNEFLAIRDSTIEVYTERAKVFKLARTIPTGANRVRSCSYSNSGQKLIIHEDAIRLFDLTTGKSTALNLKSIAPDSIQSMALHQNDFTLAIGLKNGGLKLVDLRRNELVDSFRLFHTYWGGRYSRGIVKDSIEIKSPIRKLCFTNSGNLLSYYSESASAYEENIDVDVSAGGFVDPKDLDRMWDNLQKELEGGRTFPTQLIALWDPAQGKPKYLEENDYDYPFVMRNNQIATKKGIRNFETGEKTLFEGVNSTVDQVKFSGDGGKLLVRANNNVWICNLATSTNSVLDHQLLTSDHLDTYNNSLGVQSDYYSKSPGLFDLDSGKIVRQLKIDGYNVRLNPVKTQLAFVDYKGWLSVIDFSTQRVLLHEYDSGHHYSYSFSADGKVFVSGDHVMGTDSYLDLDSIPGESSYRVPPVFLSRQHRLFLVDDRNSIIIRDYLTHTNLDTMLFFYGDEREIKIDSNYQNTYDLRQELPDYAEITSIEVSPDEKMLALAFGSGVIALVEPIHFRILHLLRASSGEIKSIAFRPDNRYLVSTDIEGSIHWWDLTTHEVIAKILFYDKDWVAVNRDNLFDGSAGGLAKLFFIKGLQTIDLNQLKARYYEPGLWRKIIRGEKLRSVLGFNKMELPPEIRVGQVDKKGNLPIEVINRGGGIGEVALYINGKEVIKDLRKPGTDAKGSSISFSIPISSDKNLIPGTENFLAVKAWNAGQWIESRGTIVKYVAPSKSEIKPAIYIVVCGVSDYTGDEIDLKYAAKDAEEISRALELGAKRLFGIDKSYVYTLTTTQKPDRYPTKANILKTFEKISTSASSADVIVVYLSGHGINLGGADGDFYYLTQDAYTASASAYNDPAIEQQTTLSSQELVELFKKVPALKQVLIIDACASGKVVDNLMAKRDIESGTLRALDRMKDRTGMHIITGCTADAVSYEASRYGQGVLTYSLLEGLRGLALREEKFVDVNQLFQFAQERVPVLASGIGGIQTPQVFSPNGSQSFDFGELTTEDKKQISLAKARPVYIRSTFIDQQKLRDVLGLGKRMDEMLNEASTKGESSPLLFSDVSEYPDGCQLSGEYKQTAGNISLRLNKTCEGKEVLNNFEARDEKELLEKIMAFLGKQAN